MQFDILTTFPSSFSYLNESILKRAQEKELVKIHIHDLRQWTTDKRKTTDDRPFGGGAGMLMKIEPIYKALKELGVYPNKNPNTKVILTSARGTLWNQSHAKECVQKFERLVIICGHYEGIDHRVVEHLIDEEISIGNYVLSGGEIPSMVLIDSITRLIPGVLGNEDSLAEESHNSLNEIEYPQYTRPAGFITDEGESWNVPGILLSGDPKKVKEWQDKQ